MLVPATTARAIKIPGAIEPTRLRSASADMTAANNSSNDSKVQPQEQKANPFQAANQTLAADYLKQKLLSKSAPASYSLTEEDEMNQKKSEIRRNLDIVRKDADQASTYNQFKKLILKAFELNDATLAFEIYSKAIKIVTNNKERADLFVRFIKNYPDKMPGVKREHLRQVFNLLIIHDPKVVDYLNYAIHYFKAEEDLDTVAILQQLYYKL